MVYERENCVVEGLVLQHVLDQQAGNDLEEALEVLVVDLDVRL